MPEDPQKTGFKYDLAELGPVVRFDTPEQMREWIDAEYEKWRWVGNAGRPHMDSVYQIHSACYAALRNSVSEWGARLANHQNPQPALEALTGVVTESYVQKKMLHSESDQGRFILGLLAAKGGNIASGAYAALLGHHLSSAPLNSKFIEGMFEGFLYLRQVDWAANAQREQFNDLRAQYTRNLEEQHRRFRELETQNATLNEGFSIALREKSTALDTLHQQQGTEFTKLIDKHTQELKAIETTYDEKLALQKPVQYWEKKEWSHRWRSLVFGIVALLTGSASAAGLGWATYKVLEKLQQNENPKHWQIGLLVIGAFFAVWLVRVLVRLFFSNLHLATDAAERRVMIQTYLALSRDGTKFEPDDRKLIMQHIFRSASDGIVKDDAAPPSFWSIFTGGGKP